MSHRYHFLRFLIVAVLLGCLFTPAAPTFAAVNIWTRSGLTGGNITSLAIDPSNPNTLYAGTYGGGIYKSADGGASWNPANNYTPVNGNSHIITLIFVDPFHSNDVYFFTPYGKYRSTNGGGQWDTLVTAGIPTTASVTALAFDPSASGVVYASTDDGLYQSTDSGDHWTQKSAAQSGNASVNWLFVAPTNSLILYSATWGGSFYKSTDGGSSWNPAKNGLPGSRSFSDLIIDPKDAATLYVILYDSSTRLNSLYKTVDGGANWNPASTGLDLTQIQIYALAVDPATPTTLYLGTNLGIFKSVNGAGNWTLLNSEKTVYVLAVNPTAPATVYAGTSAHVLKTTDSGQNWNQSDAGMTATNIDSLVIDPVSPANLYIASITRGVLKSRDHGATWNYSTNGITSSIQFLAVDPQTPAVLYGGAFKGIFKSTDGGENWVAMTNELSDSNIVGLWIDPTNSARMYARDFSTGLYWSVNHGDTWAYMGGNITGGLLIDPIQPSILYIVDGSGGISRWTAEYMYWATIDTGLPESRSVRSLVADSKTPATLYAGGRSTTYENGQAIYHPLLYKSTDNGNNWIPAQTGLPDSGSEVISLAVNPSKPNILYATLRSGGVYKSTNGGANWLPFSLGLDFPRLVVGSLAIDPKNPTNLYAGTSGGGLYSTQSVEYGQFLPVIQR